VVCAVLYLQPRCHPYTVYKLNSFCINFQLRLVTFKKCILHCYRCLLQSQVNRKYRQFHLALPKNFQKYNIWSWIPRFDIFEKNIRFWCCLINKLEEKLKSSSIRIFSVENLSLTVEKLQIFSPNFLNSQLHWNKTRSVGAAADGSW